jgi:hypothetical protein
MAGMDKSEKWTPSTMGKKGGRARMAQLSAKERKALGKAAIEARWRGKKKKAKGK